MTVSIPPIRERPRVPPLAAFLEGWRRVLRAPALLVGTWAIWMALAGLLSVAVSPIPALQTLDVVPDAGPLDRWALLVRQELPRVAALFAPELAIVLQPSAWPPAWTAALGLQALLAIFLSGGILDRYARGRPIGAAAFFAACGVYFFRFLRLLAMVAALAYLLWLVAAALPDGLATRTVVIAAVVALALIVDFAKARTVVEDRRSMLGALTAAARFARRRGWRVVVLALLNGLALLIVLRLQFQMGLSPSVAWISVGLEAALLLLAVSTRLAFMASEVVFFQGELAHAGYTAAPLPVWPDSPAVEAMENLRRFHEP
jgi:hypothetical protein